MTLPDEKAKHVYRALRAHPGDKIEVVDGGGRLFVAELLGGREATVAEEKAIDFADEGNVILYQAVPKGRRMDLVVEKATELGVGCIVPLLTERSVAKPSVGDGKVRRWRRVAEAAARQSLRLRVPEVGEVVSFAEAVREAGKDGLLLHNGPGLSPLEAVVSVETARLFVGPEGGWSEYEISAAERRGLSLASLGPYRLRSETAGIVAVTRACTVLEHIRS